MARIRTIKPKFWDDSKLAKVSRDARLTYIGMWNFSDDLGVVNAESKWLKSKIFPYDVIQLQQFEKWLTELVKNGFINLFSHDEEKFYYLPNLTKHQVINRPNYEEVFVKKELLDALINDSLINHGTITDQSLPERKGKEEEGKGKERSVEKKITPPTLIEVTEFFKEKNYSSETAKKAFDYYEAGNWHDGKGSPVKNWKQKMLAVWMKDENLNKNQKNVRQTGVQPNKSKFGKFPTGR